MTRPDAKRRLNQELIAVRERLDAGVDLLVRALALHDLMALAQSDFPIARMIDMQGLHGEVVALKADIDEFKRRRPQ